ncbi:MAG: LCP family protein, partial [Actinomycetaceae bacterium]|nr:LCP family protein [Actinomycetaceae bacterium]
MAIISWFAYIFMYGNSKLEHVEALSGRADTPGETYLIVGSDKRESGAVDDGTDGQRADTIMVLQLPDTGHAALISLPRDTLVEIPGYGMSKINAAYAYGGPALLVQTVENLTGLTVDHYVEVSMGGVQNLVNAVDGVNLCYDEDVSDAYSGMEWTAGCHDVNGDQALAFSRMRYSDPLGDIGRTMRQRQVVSKVIDKAASSSTLAHPMRQRAIVGAAADNLTTDTGTSLFGLAQAGLGLRFAMGEGGLMGTPPISNMGYWY